MKALRICLVASEAAPFAKTGGLGDVTSALAAQLARRGHDARLFLPFYARIDLGAGEIHRVEFLRDVPVDMGGRILRFTAYTTPLPGSSDWIYLIDCPELYRRPGIYTSDGDESLRFAFLARAATQCCQGMGWRPHVVHCHDWHAALLPLYLKSVYGWDRLLQGVRTLLTIHNIAYQGVFRSALLEPLQLARHAALLPSEDLAAGRINFLKVGILHADGLSTVSPTHARELQTPDGGWGLDGLLRARSRRLVGILNGVDYSLWDPARDPHLPFHYGPEDLGGKERNKRSLLADLGLSHDPESPVLGIVSRLVEQKGFELLFEPLPDLLGRRPLRLVVLGSGESRYEGFFRSLQVAFPTKVCFYRGFHEALAHRIEAGSDIFLMPSRYEPCGLNQMYSLKYGTPPVVHKTGGLADSVRPFDRASGEGTGFVFEHFDAAGLRWALERALDTFRDRELWRRLMLNGMAEDFSWERQVLRYEELYRRLIA